MLIQSIPGDRTKLTLPPPRKNAISSRIIDKSFSNFVTIYFDYLFKTFFNISTFSGEKNHFNNCTLFIFSLSYAAIKKPSINEKIPVGF